MSQETLSGAVQLACAAVVGGIALAARLVEGPQFYREHPVMWLAVAAAVLLAAAGTMCLWWAWRDRPTGRTWDVMQEWDHGTDADYRQAVRQVLGREPRGDWRRGDGTV